MAESCKCAQHQLLGVTTGGQLLELLHGSNVEFDGRRYENRSTFFPLLPEGKEKTFILKMFIFEFLKIGY